VFLDLFQTGSIDSNLVEWVYSLNEDGTAGATAEGAAKKQIDFDLAVASQRVEKYTAYIKATDEMLDDISFMDAQIRTQLARKLRQSVELGAYSGSGVTPNLNGVYTVATAWAAGTFALTVENPNLVDVLRVGINQIMVANQPMPDYILLNPSDVTTLMLIKNSTTERQYVDALQMVAGQLMLDGIPIIRTNLVSADTFLIGNSSLQSLLQKGDIMIEVGYDSDDFTKNYKTVRAEWRGVVFVQTNDRTAFIKGTISTAITALTAP
jgi:HK97 family phage major capsid protein